VRLLALDQASRTSGFAIFDDDELIDYGTFTYDDEDIGIRLHKIRNKVASLIDKYAIDYVVFEDIQMQGNVTNNVQTFKILAEVFGVIYELVTDLDITHDAVLSSTWKSTLGIKGRTRPEQKKNAQTYVIDTYGVKPSQDASDAICIGAHILKHGCEPITENFDWSE
jgi:Holliday junction resolvasome RuvABC endonuclease subunit